MTPLKTLLLTSVVALTAASSASASELIFRFNNPNFGGNPLNGTYLFGLAEAQRSATARDAGGSGGAGGGDAPVGGIGGGSIGGPTIIIPITTGSPGAPVLDADGSVDQVSQ